MIDWSARVVVANEAAAALFGVPVRELLGPAAERHPGRHARRPRAPLADAVPLMRALSGEEVTGAGRALRAPRRLAALGRVHANPLTDDDGELYGAVASSTT